MVHPSLVPGMAKCMCSVKFTCTKLFMLISLTNYVTAILYEVLFAGQEHMEPCNIWCMTLLCCIQLAGPSPMNFCTSISCAS